MLCTALVAYWVRSYRRCDVVGVPLGPVGIAAASYREHLVWSCGVFAPDAHFEFKYDSTGADDVHVASVWQYLGSGRRGGWRASATPRSNRARLQTTSPAY